MNLIKPDASFKQSYLSYILELGSEERYPFPLDFDHSDFSALLKKINDFEQGIHLPEGYVPSSTYWMVQGDELVGVSNLHHHLSDQLLTAGGHIGLGIRPSYRGQGLSIKLLNLTLEQASERGIKQVHIHCYAENKASAHMILACGGVLDSVIEDGGHVVQRYLIDLYN